MYITTDYFTLLLGGVAKIYILILKRYEIWIWWALLVNSLVGCNIRLKNLQKKVKDSKILQWIARLYDYIMCNILEWFKITGQNQEKLM